MMLVKTLLNVDSAKLLKYTHEIEGLLKGISKNLLWQTSEIFVALQQDTEIILFMDKSDSSWLAKRQRDLLVTKK